MQDGARLFETGGEEVQEELKRFKDALSSCYGPWNQQALLVSAPTGGGAVTLTKRATRLLQLLHTSHPLIRNMISHLQGHAHCYRDSTLYAGMLCCNLILRGLKLARPRRKVAMAISHTLSMVGVWLRDPTCPVQYELDLSHVEQLLTFLTSYLGPKMSMLSQQELQHLATLLVKGFLRALPGEGNSPVSVLERIYFLPASYISLGHTHQSCLYEGLLITQDMCPSLLSWSDISSGCSLSKGRVLTVVMDTSLAGDIPQGSEFTAVGVTGLNMDDVMEAELMAMGRVLLERGVGLLACQKCIHPVLKEMLVSEGVVVLERLSSLLLGPVHRLCGGDLLSSPSPHTLRQCQLGTLADVRRIQVLGQWYLQIKGESDSHSTLVLCSDSERNLDELHPLCQDALRMLECCVADPQVICGGGCGDTYIADYIREKGGECLPDNLRCVTDVVEMVAQCFEQQACSLERHGGVVLTDNTHHHCWVWSPGDVTSPSPSPSEQHSKTCNCGAISIHDISSHTSWRTLQSLQVPHPLSLTTPPDSTHLHERQLPTVFDLLAPRTAALTCANEMCQTILTTSFIISQAEQ